MPPMLILDFDGTVTDAEQEGVPFREGYLEDLATLTGQSLQTIRALATRFEAEVAANPDAHGWMYNGRIVAPATVDPYLRIMPVARLIFDQFGVFMDERDRTRLLDGILYKYNYTKTVIAFRDGARESLLLASPHTVYIVTNSHTEPVQQKVLSLGETGRGDNLLETLAARVIGRARKYEVDEHFDAVPSHLEVPGLSRPVLLRRPRYYDVLEGLRQQHQLQWQDITVVGDIFELDLALPLALGASVILMVNAFTPRYEQDFLRACPRARLMHHASEIGLLYTSDDGG